MALVNELIGELKRYQIWICFILFLSKVGVAFHQMAIVFLAPPVEYICPDSNSTCCDNPVFNTDDFSRTIVMEWNLICERAWLKDFTQTLFQFGVLSGSFLCGIASDRYGRRPILIGSVIVEVFAGLMTSFLPDYWSFTIARMILGVSIGGVMVVAFVLVMEYVGHKYRDVVSALFHVPFTTGHIFLAVFGYFVRDYVYFQLGISLLNVILLTYICILPESTRWLLAVNKTSQAISLMEHIAKINRLPTDEIRNKIETYQFEYKNSLRKGNVLDLFRRPKLRKNMIIMSFSWFVCSYCFYGVAHYISHLTGHIYINVIAIGCVCLAACFIVIPIMKFVGRRKATVICMIANSLCLFIIAIIPEGSISIAFGCIGILFGYMVFLIVYLYCSEMFPTVVRNAALGIASMLARIGGMIAPFIAGLKPYGKWCAPVAFGMFPLIAAIMVLWLPETKDCELTMTIEESEEVLRNNSTTRRNSHRSTSSATGGVT